MKFVFDIDGVLIRSRAPDGAFLWSKNLAVDLGLPSAVMKRLFDKKNWSEILCGRADFADFLGRLFLENGVTTRVEQFIEYWLRGDLHWNRAALEVAAELLAVGHELCIASNQDRLRGEFLRSQPEICSNFTHVVTSADLGVCKPDIRYYQSLLSRYFDGQASGVIVIDDNADNISSACAAGFRGIRFDPDMQRAHDSEWLRAEIQSILT